MPEEVLHVLQTAATTADPKASSEALAAACFAGPLALRWINNAEEDQPAEVIPSPILNRRRTKNTANSVDHGAAAK